jgi:hypothetical protein
MKIIINLCRNVIISIGNHVTKDTIWEQCYSMLKHQNQKGRNNSNLETRNKLEKFTILSLNYLMNGEDKE